jgi:hypothetical protein
MKLRIVYLTERAPKGFGLFDRLIHNSEIPDVVSGFATDDVRDL